MRRRVLTDEEWYALMAACTASIRRIGRMPGLHRRRLYELARWSGLRVKSLRALRLCDLRPHAGRWWLDVQAAKYTRAWRLPIPARMVADLRKTLPAGRPVRADRPLFCLPRDPARMLAADLARAGIPRDTPAGRYDFHALRVQAAVDLRRAGLALPQIRCWLGHRDHRTTQRYLVEATDGELAEMADQREYAPARAWHIPA